MKADELDLLAEVSALLSQKTTTKAGSSTTEVHEIHALLPLSSESEGSDMRRRAARSQPRRYSVFIICIVFIVLPIVFGAAGFALSAVVFEAKREGNTFQAEARVLTARHASPWLLTLLSIERNEVREDSMESTPLPTSFRSAADVALAPSDSPSPTLAPTPLPTSLGAPPFARLPPNDLWSRDVERALERARKRGTQ